MGDYRTGSLPPVRPENDWLAGSRARAGWALDLLREGLPSGLGEAFLKSNEAPADHGAVPVVGHCIERGDPGGELLLG
jgi:hypothetical protein